MSRVLKLNIDRVTSLFHWAHVLGECYFLVDRPIDEPVDPGYLFEQAA